MQVLLAKMKNAKNHKEMLEYSLILDRIVMGEHSLAGDPKRSAELARAHEGAEARDTAAEAFNRDAAGFLDDAFARGEKHKLTGDAAEREKAKGAKMLKVARAGKMAERRTKELELDRVIEHGPKVTVMGQGQWVEIGSRPNSVRKLRPDIVGIMHRYWTIQPGLNEGVPEVFAKQYELILRSRQETADRERLMTSNLEVSKLEAALSRVDNLYGTRRQHLGAA